MQRFWNNSNALEVKKAQEGEPDALATLMRDDAAKEEKDHQAYRGDVSGKVPSLQPSPSSTSLEKLLLSNVSTTPVGIQTVFCQPLCEVFEYVATQWLL